MIVVYIVVIVIFLWVFLKRGEGMANAPVYATRAEKAGAMVDWWNRTGGAGKYTDFRAALGGGSNIVEYYLVRKLASGKALIHTKDILAII